MKMENELVQGSDQWKQWRKTAGIGGSEASICLGVNPWRTRHNLWLEKVGLTQGIEQNEAMRRGLELEPYARDWAERELGLSFIPTVRKSRTVDFMFGSADGWNEDNAVLLEIKSPMNGLHDKVPDYYLPQCYHLMVVFEVKKMLYMSFDGCHGKIIEVYKDDPYIENLIEAEREFWHHVQSFTEPELTDRDYIKREDKEYQEKLMVYLNNKEQAKKWKELEDRSKDELVSMTERNTICNGCKISQRTRQGNVDYRELTKQLEISEFVVSQYKKQPTTFWDIR
jgi:putative phage-type endonuclease